jgi:hypothetical protein
MRVKYQVKRPDDHPGPGVLRLLLKGSERRMERGGVTEVSLDLDEIQDLKVMRDLKSTGYEVTEAGSPLPPVDEIIADDLRSRHSAEIRRARRTKEE